MTDTVRMLVDALQAMVDAHAVPSSLCKERPVYEQALAALAAASNCPKVKPVAWMRKWAFDGEKQKKERNQNGRLAWPLRFKFLPVTESQLCRDDVPLCAMPQPPKDTP